MKAASHMTNVVSHQFHMANVCVRVCVVAVDTQGVSRPKPLFLRDRSPPRAPNHRHYPDPHCCAIPALKRLCTVPVRLAWHCQTIAHAIRAPCDIHGCSLVLCSWLAWKEILNAHFNQKCHYECASDGRFPCVRCHGNL